MGDAAYKAAASSVEREDDDTAEEFDQWWLTAGEAIYRAWKRESEDKPEPVLLCPLKHGDMIDVNWSGQNRTVAFVAAPFAGLRDLTGEEMTQLEVESARYAADSYPR